MSMGFRDSTTVSASTAKICMPQQQGRWHAKKILNLCQEYIHPNNVRIMSVRPLIEKGEIFSPQARRSGLDRGMPESLPGSASLRPH